MHRGLSKWLDLHRVLHLYRLLELLNKLYPTILFHGRNRRPRTSTAPGPRHDYRNQYEDEEDQGDAARSPVRNRRRR